MRSFKNVINIQETFQTFLWVLSREKTQGKTNTASEGYFVLNSYSILWDLEPTMYFLKDH